jgi:site-specific DNA-methyltransferase (adenine-specific)
MEQYDKEKKLFYPSSKEGALRLKMYLDESKGITIQDIWIDVKKNVKTTQRKNQRHS